MAGRPGIAGCCRRLPSPFGVVSKGGLMFWLGVLVGAALVAVGLYLFSKWAQRL